MRLSLTEPATLLILCLIVGFVVGLNATLFGYLRGNPRVREEASKWAAAADAGRSTRATQAAQLAELHQAVEKLQKPAPGSDDPPHD
jgi:hypothetical protein